MSVINRITCNDGDFVGAFRQNVIRVIGNYGLEQEPDEYDDKIKAKQEEMVALIAENAKEVPTPMNSMKGTERLLKKSAL